MGGHGLLRFGDRVIATALAIRVGQRVGGGLRVWDRGAESGAGLRRLGPERRGRRGRVGEVQDRVTQTGHRAGRRTTARPQVTISVSGFFGEGGDLFALARCLASVSESRFRAWPRVATAPSSLGRGRRRWVAIRSAGHRGVGPFASAGRSGRAPDTRRGRRDRVSFTSPGRRRFGLRLRIRAAPPGAAPGGGEGFDGDRRRHGRAGSAPRTRPWPGSWDRR